MHATPRIQTAIDYMKAAHRSIGQTRKDGVRPYEIHPLGVAERVASVTRDEDVIIAALLHDVIEDVFPLNPEFSFADIANGFGLVVHGYVDDLTDKYAKEAHPTLNRATRKQLERERYATMKFGSMLVKLADIAENCSDPSDDVGFMRMYLKEKTLCLPYLARSYKQSGLSFYQEHAILFAQAEAVLTEQKKKFDVR